MNTFSKFLSTTGTLLATAGTLNAAPVNMTLPGHAGAVNALAVSADGSVIVSGSADGTAKVYDAQGGLTLLLGDGQNAVSAVAVAPDGSWAAMGNHDRRASRCGPFPASRWPASRSTARSRAATSRRAAARSSTGGEPDGAYLAACTSDGALRVYSTSNWTAYDTETVTQLISALAFKADSSAIVAGTWDEILRNYSVSSKGFSGSNIAGHTGAVEDITLSPAGTTIAVTSEGEVWRWNGSTVLDHRALGRGWLNAVAAGAGSIAVGGQDNTVYMLSASDLTDAGSICGFEDDITALALTGDGSRLCIGTGQGEVWIYAMNGSDLKHFNGTSAPPTTWPSPRAAGACSASPLTGSCASKPSIRRRIPLSASTRSWARSHLLPTERSSRWEATGAARASVWGEKATWIRWASWASTAAVTTRWPSAPTAAW
jgi:WD40 repeat protein